MSDIGFILTWERLDRIERKLNRLLHLEREELMDLTALQTAVANETTVGQSAITLLAQLTALVQANIGDPVALQTIVDQVNADSQSLSAAVTANTPAA